MSKLKSINTNGHLISEGDNKKEREQELKMMMKRLEAKYAALQVVPVITKLGTPQVHSSFVS